MRALLAGTLLALGSAVKAEPLPEGTFKLRQSLAIPSPGSHLRLDVQLPRVTYADPKGAERLKGIAAGIELTPNAFVGLRLSGPKRLRSTLAPDPRLDAPRSTKKFAVGMTLKF